MIEKKFEIRVCKVSMMMKAFHKVLWQFNGFQKYKIIFIPFGF